MKMIDVETTKKLRRMTGMVKDSLIIGTGTFLVGVAYTALAVFGTRED